MTGVKTSTRLAAVLVTARSSKNQPATGLQVVIDALATLIPEVEALEQAHPTDAVSPLDELKRKQEEAAEVFRQATGALRHSVRDFRTGLSEMLRDAADALSDE